MDTKKLRQKILDLAIRGKLVPQDPNDEPASVLLERIRAEKEQLIKEGKIKRSKKSVASDTSHYENVPFEVPEGWCWTTLGEIGNWQAGATPSRMRKDYYGGNIPWLKTGDLTDGYIYEIPETITDKALEETSVKLNPTGSVLIAMYGATIGKIGILTFPATTNQACCACVDYKAVTQKYLFNFLLSHKEEFVKMGGGGAQPNISKEKIISTLIPIPPIAEQNRIADEIERLITFIEAIELNQGRLEQSLKLCKERILDMALSGKLIPQDDEPAIELLRKINPSFTPADNRHYGNTKITIPRNWCWVKLGEIFDVVSAKRVFQSEWQKTGIPFYRAREIVKLSNCGHVDNELYISIEHFESLKNKYGAPEADDIMLSAVGTIGKCYIVNKNDRFYYKDASVLCLKNIHNLNSEYIKFVLDSSVVQMQMQDQSKGTTVDTITIEKAKGYYIPLPPVTEQSRIVKAITLINHTIDKIAAIL